MNAVLARLRALGADFTPDQIVATRELFAPLVPRPSDVGAQVQRDLRYGPDERNRLDVFSPARSRALPVVVYIHGGGFVQGDKGDAAAPFFNNFGAWAVGEGFVGVTMTYRLAPAHAWPAGPQDIELAVQYLKAHVSAAGGDPARLVLVGQSAGGTHVSGWIARQGCEPATRAEAAGAVMLSGIFDFGIASPSPMHDAYLGSDRSLHAGRSTLAALADSRLPCMFTIGELEPPQFQRQAAAVVAACHASRGRYPEMHYLVGHNHVSSVMQVGSAVDSVGPLLAQFVRRVTGESP